MKVALALFAKDAKNAAPTAFLDVPCAEIVCAIIGPGMMSIEGRHRIRKSAPPVKPHSLIRMSIAACILAACPTTVRAQAPKHLKTWTFILPHGTVDIDVELYPDGKCRLGIGPSQAGDEASVEDEVQPLKQVLAEMPGLGADPRKLTYMDTRIRSQDVRMKVAYACADSRQCRFNMQSSEEKEVETLITLLNRTGIYDPYNDAFREYGIRVQVTSAEGVHLILLSDVPPRNARGSDNGRSGRTIVRQFQKSPSRS